MRPSGSGLYAVALTRDGARVAARLAAALPGARALVPARWASAPGVEGFAEPVAELLARLWPRARGFLLIMAGGIAVRSIAPLLQDKSRDPAVVLLDPRGRFAVSLLSGHLGGANELARAAATQLGGTPVITTATDAAGRPAAEVWARDHGLLVLDPAGVVRVNAAWANDEPVSLYVDPALGETSFWTDIEPHLAAFGRDPQGLERLPGVVMAVAPRRPAPDPALWLCPRRLLLGVGCRRAAQPEAVCAEMTAALDRHGLHAATVTAVVSVAAKRHEPALHRLAQTLGVPFRVFGAAELAQVDVPSPSSRVRSAVGTASVAEAAALLAARGGPLVLPKVKGSNWTLAAALGPLSAAGAEPGNPA